MDQHPSRDEDKEDPSNGRKKKKERRKKKEDIDGNKKTNEG